MRWTFWAQCAFVVTACHLVLAISAGASEDAWPTWRGPSSDGSIPEGNPPLEWSEDKNIRWKVEVPGLGLSSPIVWDDRVFITTAIPTGQQVEMRTTEQDQEARRSGLAPRSADEAQSFVVMALKRSDGSVIWQEEVVEAVPHEGTHPDGTWASMSPVTDGSVLIASFGSQGIFGFDLEGQQLWSTDLGDMTVRLGFGEGSSPSIYKDKVYVLWDHEGESFIVALNKSTGEEIWRQSRDEETSWSTPVVIEHDGRAQVITNATNKIRSYDSETGEVIWETGGMTLNVIPSPVYEDGIVYLTSGFRGNAIVAIKLDGAKGDITDSDNVLWSYGRDTPYVPSPLVHNGIVYFLKSNKGILSAFDAKTGEPHYQNQRIDVVRNVYASPVGVGDRIYFAGRDGGGLVIKAGPELEILGENELDDRFDASMAIVDDEIYLRGRKAIYCITEGGK